MTGYDSRLITPPSEAEELYPYRRVWQSIALEMGILAGLVGVLFIATRFGTFPEELAQVISPIIALIPFVLWLIFSWWRERFALRPRRNLLAVAVISGLAANAVAIPLINSVFQLDRWLSLESAINRIVGYTFTLGILQAIVIYLILRYVVWPLHFQIRLDGVAFGASSAAGYAAAANLHAALSTPTPPLVTAMNTFNQQAVLLCTGIIIGYALAEVWFNPHPFPLVPALALALAALVTGIAIPLVAGFANTTILPSAPVGSVSPIQGFLFAAALLMLISVVFNFLFEVADRQVDPIRVDDADSLSQ